MKVIEIFADPQNFTPKCNIDKIYISNQLLTINAQVMIPLKNKRIFISGKFHTDK